MQDQNIETPILPGGNTPEFLAAYAEKLRTARGDLSSRHRVVKCALWKDVTLDMNFSINSWWHHFEIIGVKIFSRSLKILEIAPSFQQPTLRNYCRPHGNLT